MPARRPRAKTLIGFIRRQVAQAGVVPDDRTVLIESFRDQNGELGLAILSPFGGRLHRALKPVVARALQKLGIDVALLSADDGLIARLPGSDEPPLDLFHGLNATKAERLVREGLNESALFGLRFRQNAGLRLVDAAGRSGQRGCSGSKDCGQRTCSKSSASSTISRSSSRPGANVSTTTSTCLASAAFSTRSSRARFASSRGKEKRRRRSPGNYL